MKCKRCGKEVDKTEKFCPNCGNKVKKGKGKKIIGILVIIVIAILGMGLIGSSGEKEKTIKKLEAITEVEKNGNMYDFNYNNNQWKIRCTKENIHARLYEPDVKDLLDNVLGKDSGNEYEFVYDFKNEIAIYSDLEKDGNTYSTITYDIDKDKFKIMENSSDWYELSDEFEKYIRDSGIIDTMKEDISTMKKILKKNDLTFDEIRELDYGSVKKYMEKK